MTKTSYFHGTISKALDGYLRAASSKAKMEGNVVLTFTDKMKGLKVRSVIGNPKSLKEVFDKFCDTDGEKHIRLKLPFYDNERNAIYGTNGSIILIADIPDGLTKGVAKAIGFETQDSIDIERAIPDRTVSDYKLACMSEIVTIEKGDDNHNAIMAMVECVRAYEHTNEDGYLRTIHARIGKKAYNMRYIAKSVHSLFKMGNRKIGIYEECGRVSTKAPSTTPLHIIGLEDENGNRQTNGSRCLVMPIYEWVGPCFMIPTNGEK